MTKSVCWRNSDVPKYAWMMELGKFVGRVHVVCISPSRVRDFNRAHCVDADSRRSRSSWSPCAGGSRNLKQSVHRAMS